MTTGDPWQEFFSAIQGDDLDEAMSSIDSLIQKEPSDPEHFHKMGDLSARDDRPADAIKSYLKALALYEESNARGKAILMCKNILSIDPGNKTAKERLEVLVKEHEDERKVKIRIDPGKFTRQKEAPASPPTEQKGFVLSERTPGPLKEVLEEHSEDILKNIGVIHFRSGNEIIREGEVGDTVFIILNGEVEVSSMIQGKRIGLAELGEGDIFGEMAFLTSKPRSATVTAISDVEIIELPKPMLEQLVAPRPDVLRYLYNIYTSRMDITLNKLKDPKETLAGNLSELSLADLLQIFEQSKKEGVLKINSEGRKGTVSVTNGIVMNASFNGLDGEDAIVEMLALEKGRFNYEQKEIEGGNIQKPVSFLLMESMRLIDERSALEKYIPEGDRMLVLLNEPEPEDDDTKAVIASLSAGPRSMTKAHASSGISRIRFELALAKLIKAHFVEAED